MKNRRKLRSPRATCKSVDDLLWNGVNNAVIFLEDLEIFTETHYGVRLRTMRDVGGYERRALEEHRWTSSQKHPNVDKFIEVVEQAWCAK